MKQRLETLDRKFIFDAAIDQATCAAQGDLPPQDVAVEKVSVADLGARARTTSGAISRCDHALTHASALWTNAVDLAERVGSSR